MALALVLQSQNVQWTGEDAEAVKSLTSKEGGKKGLSNYVLKTVLFGLKSSDRHLLLAKESWVESLTRFVVASVVATEGEGLNEAVFISQALDLLEAVKNAGQKDFLPLFEEPDVKSALRVVSLYFEASVSLSDVCVPRRFRKGHPTVLCRKGRRTSSTSAQAHSPFLPSVFNRTSSCSPTPVALNGVFLCFCVFRILSLVKASLTTGHVD